MAGGFVVNPFTGQLDYYGTDDLVLTSLATSFTIAGGDTPVTLDVKTNVTLDQDLQKSASVEHGLQVKQAYNATNYMTSVVGSDGDLTITTVDSDGAAGHISFAPDGDTKFTTGRVVIGEPVVDFGVLQVGKALDSGGTLDERTLFAFDDIGSIGYRFAIEGGDNLVLDPVSGVARKFILDNSGAQTLDLIIRDGKLGILAETFGANMVGGLALATGTAPTGDVANQFAMFSADIVAGNAAPHVRTEIGAIVKLYQQAHIADPAESIAANNAAIDAILVALENNGLLANV